MWLKVNEVSFPIAHVRDRYVRGPGIHRRFVQLDSVYRNLNDIEQGLHDFLIYKAPLFGKKPEHEMILVARAAIENAQILLEIVEAETEGVFEQNA